LGWRALLWVVVTKIQLTKLLIERNQGRTMNPLLPRPKGDKDAEGMKKQIPNNQ
jgi:hypothetical protein